MSESPTAATSVNHLIGWLTRRLPAASLAWLEERRRSLSSDADATRLAVAFGLVPRRLGKADLDLDAKELAAAARLRPGLDPRTWSIDQAARLVLVLETAATASERFPMLLGSLFTHADVGELIALYRGLPLYPDPPCHLLRAREGIRSGMQPVFEAVAHGSPYPSEHFDEAAFDQMVVKALFVGSRLEPIQGLDARRNPTLARMLTDYAHERWAADRPVSPELWRCVGPFADAGMLADLGRVLHTGSEVERAAAALALAECPSGEAAALLGQVPELRARIGDGSLSWAALGA